VARVLLVQPPLTFAELFAKGTDEASTISPPLGLAYIAAYLRERGHACVIIDGIAEQVSVDAIAERAAEFDVVGITVLSTFALRALEIISAIRTRRPRPSIVVGGAHATALPEAMVERGADYVVVGEGEETMFELVESLCSRNRPVDRVRGLVFRRDGETVHTPPRPFIEPLDRVPMPARNLLPMNRYRDTILRAPERPSHSMMTSRGCRGACTFCHKKTFGTKVRYFTPERIVEEILLLQSQYGARHVSIYDDNFLTDHDFVLAVCEGLRQRAAAVSLSVAGRVDVVNEDVLRALKNARCIKIEYGIESGCQRILDYTSKHITKDGIRRTIRLTKEVGIPSRGFFILGFPTETAAEMEETIRFALELDMDLASFTLLTPFPGTVDYRRALHSGTFRDPEYFHHEIVPDFAFPDNPLYVPEGMTAQELLAVHRQAYRRYYLRPRMVMRRLLSLRSAQGLRAMAGGALSLVRKRA